MPRLKTSRPRVARRPGSRVCVSSWRKPHLGAQRAAEVATDALVVHGAAGTLAGHQPCIQRVPGGDPEPGEVVRRDVVRGGDSADLLEAGAAREHRHRRHEVAPGEMGCRPAAAWRRAGEARTPRGDAPLGRRWAASPKTSPTPGRMSGSCDANRSGRHASSVVDERDELLRSRGSMRGCAPRMRPPAGARSTLTRAPNRLSTAGVSSVDPSSTTISSTA